MGVLSTRVLAVLMTLPGAVGTASAVAPPLSDATAEVRAVLSRHCAGCHGLQAKPKGGLGRITDLAHLLELGQVIPSKPGQSPLFERVASGEMPPSPNKSGFGPRDAEILRRWIVSGASVSASPTRPVAESELYQTVLADLEALPARDRRFVRYLTLGHLAGASASERLLLRQAVTKLVNSLSWHARLSVPQGLGGNLIFRVDLRHYRWNARQWDRLTSAYPYAVRNADAKLRRLGTLTMSDRPLVRADWFVATACRAANYHDLLTLPSTDRALERLVQVDTAASAEEGTSIRAGFNGSGVARANRVIERHDSVYGAYWRSFDFTDNTSRQNLFAHPLGPAQGPAGFRHAGGEIIFHLPNGLQGYLLADADGKRVDRAPGEIVTDPKRPDRLVENGVSCMGCHVAGIIPKDDQVRAHVLRNKEAFGRETLEDVLALYQTPARLKRHVLEDNERFAVALRKLGIAPSDPEPISSVVLAYEATVTLSRAAGELGVSVERLTELLRSDAELSRTLGPLRSRGVVQRQVFEDSFPRLLEKAGGLPTQTDLTVATEPLAATGTYRGHRGTVRAVAWSADSKRFASVDDEGEVRLWDLSRRTSRLLGKHTGEANAVAFTTDGKRLLTGGADRLLRMWDLSDGRQIAALVGHTGGIRAVAMYDHLALSAGEDRTIRVWDLRSREQTRTLTGHTKTVYALAVSRDGKVLSGSGDRTARLWHLPDGTLTRRFDSPREVTALGFSTDGKLAAFGTGDRSVIVQRTEGGSMVRRLAGLSGSLVLVALGQNGGEVVSVARSSAGEGGSVNRHRMSDGKQVQVSGPAAVEAAAVAADGRILIAVGKEISLVR